MSGLEQTNKYLVSGTQYMLYKVQYTRYIIAQGLVLTLELS